MCSTKKQLRLQNLDNNILQSLENKDEEVISMVDDYILKQTSSFLFNKI